MYYLSAFVNSHFHHFFSFFFFNDSASTEIYTLSLHDALPIFRERGELQLGPFMAFLKDSPDALDGQIAAQPGSKAKRSRSEEHTSELQSRGHLVCRLLLEKKKKT